MQRLVIGALLVLANYSAVAQDENVIVGAGAALKCGDWSAERARSSASGSSTPREAFAVMWAQGFVSGVNTERMGSSQSPRFSIPSADVLSAMLDKECRSDPLQSLWIAMVGISRQLSERMPIKVK
jgi:hypothetical protein